MLKIINSMKTLSILILCGMGFISAQNPAPLIPTIYAKADSGKIIINWTSEAINSIDDSTGYRDFEGFRIYKSTDGGETWGGPDDRIYYNGEAKGWNPLVQFDLSVEEDSLFSLKDIDYEIDEEDMVCTGDLITSCASDQQCENNGKCTNPNLRFTRISGIDPLAPWMNLGENTGLEYTYTDNDVYNGKEYTYAVVSYDMGLRSYELSYVTPDDNSGICTAFDNSETMTTEEACCTSNSGAWDSELDRCTYLDCSECSWEELFNQVQDWDVTNPYQYSNPNGNGYASAECDITDINMVTAIPGFYAENVENISFEGVENADGIILQAEDQTVGNGLKSFMIVNQDDLTESVYRFEIQADYLLDSQSDTVDVYGGYITGDPSLYVYEVISTADVSPLNYTGYELIEENFSEIITRFGFDKNLSKCNPELPASYDVAECISLLSDLLLGLPGAMLDQDGEYRVPVYKFEDFEIEYSDDLGAAGNFTDFIDGLKFRFDNSLFAQPSDQAAAVNSLKYIYGNTSGERDTIIFENTQFLDFALKYGSDSFGKRPPYTYSIKFSSEPKYEVERSAPSSGCSDNPGYTLLPFEITNLTTGKVVGIYHTDRGTHYKDIGVYTNCDPTCGSTQWCNNGVCTELVGAKDCYWQRGENIAFKLDEISTLTEDVTEEYTFDLYITFATYGGAPYDSSKTYNEGTYVRDSGGLWVASGSISPYTEPTLWIDNNNDGINDNPWKPSYPWEDGDELLIEPTNWYADGDAWIADFSQIGLKTDINEDDLSKISVVPNPYFSHSRFDETATSRLMWFTHLPTLCDISIFTISGELVTTLEHNSEFSGQESWDLRSGNGDEVAPGLYIYTVEAGNDDKFKHIGKFAIVR